MNKELTNYTNNELLNEILDRVDQESTTIPFLTDLYIMIGKVTVECPDLYQAIINEVKKRMDK
jgi:hypothetical protein